MLHTHLPPMESGEQAKWKYAENRLTLTLKWTAGGGVQAGSCCPRAAAHPSAVSSLAAILLQSQLCLNSESSRGRGSDHAQVFDGCDGCCPTPPGGSSGTGAAANTNKASPATEAARLGRQAGQCPAKESRGPDRPAPLLERSCRPPPSPAEPLPSC